MRAVIGSECPEFVVEASPRRIGSRQAVVIRTKDSEAIPLSINGQHALSFVIEFACTWDHAGKYLMVQRAAFKVLPEGKGEPLFRYEFDNGMHDRLPNAHLQVHGHRDEFLYALIRGSTGRPGQRRKAASGESNRAKPRLSDLHFPLGGARMRPCLEDVLQMLIVEFGIDAEPGALKTLAEGRARWRRRQLAAAVRDAPEEAARVLRDLGYDVVHPAGPQPEKLGKLTSI